MGIGMACTNCNVKKLNALCDHQMSGSHINCLYHDLAKSAQVFAPAGSFPFTLSPLSLFLTLSIVDLDVQRLVKAGSATANASSLAYYLRETFIEDFCRCIEAISEHHLRVGTNTFNELFAPSVSIDTRKLLQDLIAEYNYLMDPAPHVEGSTSPHESHKGSTAVSSPPADEKGNEGKGEGSRSPRAALAVAIEWNILDLRLAKAALFSPLLFPSDFYRWQWRLNGTYWIFD
jgi:hypothetical protein